MQEYLYIHSNVMSQNATGIVDTYPLNFDDWFTGDYNMFVAVRACVVWDAEEHTVLAEKREMQRERERERERNIPPKKNKHSSLRKI